MKLTLITLGVLALTGVGGLSSFAGDTPPPVSLDNNPYIELYKLRIAQAELNQRRQEALVKLANSRLDRGRRLINQQAISQEEFDTLISEASVATADVELSHKKVDEAKTYYRVVEALVKRGVSIPLCTYEME